MFSTAFSEILLVLSLVVDINPVSSFSAINAIVPNRSTRNSIKHDHHQALFMSASPGSGDDLTGKIVGKDLNGKVVAHRYLYRFSPKESSIQTPFTIEERKYYSVNKNGSLQPLDRKSFIFRGPPREPEGNDTSRHCAKVGPALFTVDGLNGMYKEEKGRSFDSSHYSSFAMALYCMENPEIIRGRGLQVGW